MLELSLHWYRECRNLGDRLGPELVRSRGVRVSWSPLEGASALTTGSLLDKVGAEQEITLVGTGFMWSGPPRPLASAKVISVRGPLTARRLRLESPVPIGDLGILATDLLMSREAPDGRIALIPHYVDKSDPRIEEVVARLGSGVCIVDVQAPSVSDTVRVIDQCAVVLSSSLHGLIVGVALGKPVAWLELGDGVVGEGFKFRDFFASLGMSARAGALTGSEDRTDLMRLASPVPTRRVSDLKRQAQGALLAALSAWEGA